MFLGNYLISYFIIQGHFEFILLREWELAVNNTVNNTQTDVNLFSYNLIQEVLL
jgi:hypothetical protein